MIAVFQKELRDCLRWSPLGMVLGLIMLWMVLPQGVYSASEMEWSLMSQLGLAASLIAIGLGLLQSLPDARNDSRGYLLHRPIKPAKLFWAKIAAGYAAYLITLAVPVVVAMIYLQTKGIERLPTNALQLVPFLLYSCVAFIFQPTVLWIVSRDARWVGTRLLPAVGAIAYAGFMAVIYQADHGPEPFQLLIQAILLGTFCLFTCITVMGARHAFVNQSQLPTRSSSNWFSLPCMIGLIISSSIFYGAVSGFITESIPKAPQDYISYQLSLDDQGQWHQLETRRSKFNWNDVQLLTRDIGSKGDFKQVDEDWALAQTSSIADCSFNEPYKFKQFRHIETINSKMAASKQIEVVAHRERLLLYDRNRRLLSVIAPNGSSNISGDTAGRFARLEFMGWQNFGDPAYSLTKSNPLLIDDNGMYQLIASECLLERLTSDGRAEKLALLLENQNSPASIWTLAGNKLTQYEVIFKPSAEGFVADWNHAKEKGQFSLPPIQKILGSQSWKIDPPDLNESLRITRTPEGQHAIILANSSTSVSDYRMLGEDGAVAPAVSVQLPTESNNLASASTVWCIPPALAALWMAIMTWLYSTTDTGLASLAGSTLCHGVLAAAATWWLGGRYKFSNRERTIWTITGLLMGFGVLVGIVSIYRRLVMAECPRCNEDRRIDLESCEHCGKLWDPPEEEGIEIFARDRSFDQVEMPSLS